jgi:hypothetical protein
MKNVFDNQKDKYYSNSLDGIFQFEIDDISEEGYQELRKIFDRAMSDASQVYKKHKTLRSNNGKRIVFQCLTGKLMNVLMAILCSFMFLTYSPSILAFGIEGGSSTITVSSILTKERAIDIGNEIELDLKKNRYSKHLKGVSIECMGYPRKVEPLRFTIENYWKDQQKYFETKVKFKYKCD